MVFLAFQAVKDCLGYLVGTRAEVC